MVDSRLETVARVVARVEGKARWLAGLATRAAVLGGAAAIVVWWVAAGSRLAHWWQGTAASLLVLALLAAPAAWLVNVRFALLELVELPQKLAGVTTRRAAQLRPGLVGPPVDRPDGGPLGALGAARSVWGVLRDYGDVVGAWGAVAQLVVPWFWLLTAAALVAVPVMVALAAVVGLVQLVS
ncbi:MAG: hypothetical protein QOG43_2732 [Actinomycetota bacterium]|jgi:hypothetical protein|nr:hypothetical protein [Actinomycetota bacterium]